MLAGDQAGKRMVLIAIFPRTGSSGRVPTAANVVPLLLLTYKIRSSDRAHTNRVPSEERTPVVYEPKVVSPGGKASAVKV
jgi:hypothetical protein